MVLSEEIRELEAYIGFSVRRGILTLESKEPYDESFSYGLCQRFYNKDVELDVAIGRTTSILLRMVGESGVDSVQKARFFSLLGNMHYLKGDFRSAIGCFMKSLSFGKDDMTPWIELMFALRANGNFGEFEAIAFNLEGIHALWRSDPATNLTRENVLGLVDTLS
ncbi:MAG TPA: hypothetical protein VJB12_02730 [Candidatus Nanoarchaeia archaeon]|nr:hypothetical protein [Candidatus Nanoarchaeia archaeon]